MLVLHNNDKSRVYLQEGKCEEQTETNLLVTWELKIPREYHWHDVHDRIKANHNGSIRVPECRLVETVSNNAGIPSARYRYALEDDAEDTTEAEYDGKHLHGRNPPVIVPQHRKMTVDSKETQLDESVTR